MSQGKTRGQDQSSTDRRAFLKKAGMAAATAPAVALLLSAESKKAAAGAVVADPYNGPIVDVVQ